MRRARSCLLLAAALAAPASARAQGLSVPVVGTSRSGAATADPAAVFHNPAMLGFARGAQLQAGLSLLGARIDYERTRRAAYQREEGLGFALPLPEDALDPAKTGRAAEVGATAIAPVPAVYGALPLGRPRLLGGLPASAGLGVGVPYAARVSYDPAGPQRFQLQQGTLAAVFVTPALAIEPRPGLAFGAGASWVLGLAELARVQDFAALDVLAGALADPPINQRNDFGPEAPSAVRELAVMARPFRLRRAVASAFTFNVGVAAEPAPALHLGLSYQHRVRLHHRGRFDLSMDDPFFTRDLASHGLLFRPLVRGRGSLSFVLPETLRAGARWRPSERLALQLAVELARWSRHRSLEVRLRSPDLAQPRLGVPDTIAVSIPRRFRDTIAARALVERRLGPALEAHALLGFATAAAPDETIDAASPDGHRVILGAGVAWALGGRASLLADLTLHRALARSVEASAHDLGNGRYRMSVLALGLHALWRLR
jgi:long-chain fatty acid transport protein